MRHLVILLSTACLVLSSLPARAQEVPQARGLTLGVRSGFGVPAGQFTHEADALRMTDVYASVVPLTLEAGLRLGPSWSIGVLAQYGVLSVQSRCESGGCSGSSFRAALQASYSLPPAWSFDPWVGLTVGYEWTQHTAPVLGRPGTLHYQGPEFAGLQAGTDYWLTRHLTVGPFLAASMGSFSQLDVTRDGRSGSEQVRARSPHVWLVAGLRIQMAFSGRRELPPELSDPALEAGAPAVVHFDAAMSELKNVDWYLEAQRSGLARRKLEKALTLVEAASRWLSDPLTAAHRPARYESRWVGRVSEAELLERIEELRLRVKEQLDALPAETDGRGEPESDGADGAH